MNPIASAVAELRRLYPPQPPAAPSAHPILGFFIVLAALAAFFWTIESIWPERRGQSKLRSGAWTDVLYFVMDTFAAKLAVVGIAAAALTLIVLRVPHHLTWIARQPLGLQAIEAMIVIDFAGYWVHRALHEVPALWKIHSIHHSSETLDWLAGVRVHPLEPVLSRTLTTIPAFLLGFSPGIAAFFGPLFGLYPILLHANVHWDFGPLRWLVASPAFHRWHHAADAGAIDKNYAGLLPVWDRLFGTAHFPAGERPRSYGIDGGSLPRSMVQQLAYPFRTAARIGA